MTKRNLFDELMDGLGALREEREGKRTLKTYTVTQSEPPKVSAEELVCLRESLHLSRPVFAGVLRTNARTLENWEQGRAKPNAQAAVLIKLVEKYPDMVERLAVV